MKRIIALFLLALFGLIACSACSGSGELNIEDNIVGKWVASGTDDPFNTYEFFADGTGTVSTPNGSLSLDLTYELTEDGTLRFYVDGIVLNVMTDVSMPDADRLTFKPDGADEAASLQRVDE
jgi:hypothetical protein